MFKPSLYIMLRKDKLCGSRKCSLILKYLHAHAEGGMDWMLVFSKNLLVAT